MLSIVDMTTLPKESNIGEKKKKKNVKKNVYNRLKSRTLHGYMDKVLVEHIKMTIQCTCTRSPRAPAPAISVTNAQYKCTH